MIDFVFSLFAFARRLFLWLPPFLYEFVVSVLNISAFVLVVAVASKLVSMGAVALKNLFS